MTDQQREAAVLAVGPVRAIGAVGAVRAIGPGLPLHA